MPPIPTTNETVKHRSSVGFGDPNCQQCHGTGYLRQDLPVGDPNFGKMVACPCQADSLREIEAQRLQQASNLEALRDKTFANFLPEGIDSNLGHRARLRQVYEVCRKFAEAPENRWLVLIGSYGCGKTHLAAAIANYRLSLTQPALFLNAPDFLDYLRSAFAPDADESYAERFDMVRKASVLIIDDLGTESPTPWANEKLYQLLNARYNERLPTVITTNKDLGLFDSRIASRLQDSAISTMYTIESTDFRSGTAVASISRLSLFKRFTFDTYYLRPELTGELRKNFMQALEAAKEFAEKPEGWLVLVGVSGVGKTHLAAAIANVRSQLDPRIIFLSSRDIVRLFRSSSAETYNDRMVIQRANDQAIDEIMNASFVVIDDVPDMAAYQVYTRERFFDIFAHRYDANLPTVWTTSLEINQLDPRIRSRFTNPIVSKLYLLTFPSYLDRKTAKKK